MSLTWNITNCNPSTLQNKADQSRHYVICSLCTVVGVGAITETNSKEAFNRFHVIEELEGPMLMDGKGHGVYLTQQDVDRFIGMTVNVAPMSNSQFVKKLRKIASDRAVRIYQNSQRH